MIAALLFLIIDKKPDFMSGFLSIKCQGQGLEKGLITQSTTAPKVVSR